MADRNSDIARICQSALERPLERRSAFVAAACDGDEALRREVESLLAQEVGADRFLETPALHVAVRQLQDVTGGHHATLEAGSRFGPYEILDVIGAGGMGEVFRARDTRLGRIVAIKTLHRSFCDDRDLQQRFEREARTLATLSHPHICAVFDVGQHDGVDFLVMEYLDGETLADRLAKGPLPVKTALAIATQIADALEAAHEKGIVHRDLKPANIKVGSDGTVRVLDFGLAKLLDSEVGRSGVAQSAVVTNPAVSSVGVILGTAAYMSPEQAEGKTADRRTDIFAFGCVLYEMLTGRRVFAGDSLPEILASVLGREPDWKTLPPTLQPRIHELLRRCLEKDPRRRWRDIGDVGIEIEHVISGTAQPVVPLIDGRSRRRTRLAWFVAGVLFVALAVAIGKPYFSRSVQAPPMRVDIVTPDMLDGTDFAISPDGRRLVFPALRSGQPLLYVRSIDEDADTARVLDGTDAATLPFWKPDGRSVGFFSGGHLKRIDLDSGRVQTLANASPGFGGTWGPEGVIVYAPGGGGQLVRVPESGGESVVVTEVPTGEPSHSLPSFLPGGRQFLFYVGGTEEARGIYVGSLDSPHITRITAADSAAAYLSPGWLMFVRQGALVARRFDATRRELSGDSVTVAKSVQVGAAHGAFTVSAAGVIAYRTAATTTRQLTWFDRSGKALGPLGEPDHAGQLGVALSPDGQRATLTHTVQNDNNIWVVDSARETKFTSEGRPGFRPLVAGRHSNRVRVEQQRLGSDPRKGVERRGR